MEHKQMLSTINDIFKLVKKIHIEGQKEYAMDEDNVFANFERISKQTDLKREMILWVYLMKHIDGIASYLKGHKSQREDVRGRLTDAIVYMCILWGMIDDVESKRKL